MPDNDPKRDIYLRQGFGGDVGIGGRPALCIVDFVNGFVDPSIFGGGNIDDAVSATRILLDSARTHRLPIAFTRLVYDANGADNCVFLRKVPSLARLTETAIESQITSRLAPEPGELIIRKTQPSAFFGTGLVSWLQGRGADTLLVAGCTTSGCVRATVVDAMSYNYRTIVVRDCVGDRSSEAHAANLFDMQQKYADSIDCADVIAALDRRRAPNS